jgi:hypothetical protein
MIQTTSQVRERPILFSSEMVRAILDGRKTMTRRIILPSPRRAPFQIRRYDPRVWFEENLQYPRHGNLMSMTWICPYGSPGDRLWVIENDPIDMPRGCRLEVEKVRVERLQSISEEDAKAEGVKPEWMSAEDVDNLGPGYDSYREGFAALWDRIDGKNPDRAWAKNPWVWAVTFRKLG